MLCQNCNKRYLGCHSNCPEYLEYKSNIEKSKNVKYKDTPIIGYIYSQHIKATKNYNRKFRK